jgi:peptidoglycan/xylan/chitin deacetylase (PgdA/CDA1 family)
MYKNYARVVLMALMICAVFNGCTKYKKNGQLNQAGVALTFDDDRVDNWFSYLPYLDSANIKATFYVCKYNRFTDEQKRKLAVIQSHGHEIAFHSTNHYNMLDYVYRYKHTINELMFNEIECGLKMMNKDGFYPTTFAYPYGAHNGLYDKKLMQYFKSVRALNGTNDFSKSLAPTEHNQLLFGLGIDKSSKRSDEVVLQVIKSASENNTCAVFVAHDINTSLKLSVTLDRLKKMAAYVKQLGLKYYTISQISN